MKNRELQRIQAAIKQMTAEEIAAVREAVQKREGQVEGSVVVQEIAASIDKCPRCGSKAVKWGSKNGIPRFKCKNEDIGTDGEKVCGKTFNALTGSPLARLHHTDKLIANAQCMVQGLTVRKTAEILGIDKDTAFRWRHRFLRLLADAQPAMLAGIVEADETFFRESFKGQRGGLPRRGKKRGTAAASRGLSVEQIPVLVARDRATGKTLTAKVGSRSAKHLEPELVPRLAKDAELVSDGASAYRTLARKHGIDLRIVPRNRKHKTSGALHINNVNAYDERLKGWMFRFKGVATKYLQNYLGWHRLLDRPGRKPSGRKFLKSVVAPEA